MEIKRIGWLFLTQRWSMCFQLSEMQVSAIHPQSELISPKSKNSKWGNQRQGPSCGSTSTRSKRLIFLIPLIYSTCFQHPLKDCSDEGMTTAARQSGDQQPVPHVKSESFGSGSLSVKAPIALPISLCPKLCPLLPATVPHNLIRPVSSSFVNQQQAREKAGDRGRDLVALPGIEPGFED